VISLIWPSLTVRTIMPQASARPRVQAVTADWPSAWISTSPVAAVSPAAGARLMSGQSPQIEEAEEFQAVVREFLGEVL